jgi:SEC-C motif-containing protein
VPAPRDCPCHSGRRYNACCAPLHRGERSAATPEELMRSRYAAFALGLGAYLKNTLAADHEDQALPDHAFAKTRLRFLDLCILHTSRDEVLFYAKIFEKGVDRSFAELSTFVREDGAWKYASGVLVPAARLPPNPRSLTRDAFLALAGGV